MARQEISRLEKLAEGVWVLVSRAPKPPLYCNSLIVELSDRSVAVDSHHSLEGARLLLNAIAQTTGKPPRHLILTHHHRDHAGGRGAFPESADIIAHENARLHLERPDVSPGRLPNVLLRDFLEIADDSRRVQALHVGRGHSDADICVWLPRERVLATGDLCFNGCLGWLGDGWPGEWVEALDRLIALEPVAVVPGHGDPGGPELLTEFRNYLSDFRLAVGALAGQGLDAAEIAARLHWEPPRDQWGMRQYLERNIERVVLELGTYSTAKSARRPS